MFGVGRPACHDSSLHFCVLVLFLEDTCGLPQINLAFNVFFISALFKLIGVLSFFVFSLSMCRSDPFAYFHRIVHITSI